MRERWSWLLLGAGLLLAVLTGVVVYATMREARPEAPRAAATRTIVVAAADLLRFSVVTADMVELQERAENAVPPGAFTSTAAVVGRTAVDFIPAGLAITEKELGAADQRGTSAALERGLVLMVIASTDSLTAARAVQPGDRVDIHATLPVGAEGAKATQSIVQNLEVVAVTSERPALLTFIVDHQTSLVLKFLKDSGAPIDLVIRSRADTQRIRTGTVDLGYLVETYGVRPSRGP